MHPIGSYFYWFYQITTRVKYYYFPKKKKSSGITTQRHITWQCFQVTIVVPWTVEYMEHALGGYCIGDKRENTRIRILVAKNRFRKTISRSNSSSNSQPQVSIFTPTNTISHKWSKISRGIRQWTQLRTFLFLGHRFAFLCRYLCHQINYYSE
jgi:hypothetical protein